MGVFTARDLAFGYNPLCSKFDDGVVSDFVDYVMENRHKYYVCRLVSAVAVKLSENNFLERLYWEGSHVDHLEDASPVLTGRILYRELDRDFDNVCNSNLEKINTDTFVEDGFKYLSSIFPGGSLPLSCEGPDNLIGQGNLFGR